MEQDNSTNDSASPCYYQPTEFLEEKFVIVGVLGTSISLVGTLTNLLAILVLGRLILRGPSALLYLFTLAFLDLLVCAEYILMLSVQIFYDYHQDFRLYRLWCAYSPIVFSAAKITQTSSTWLIVVASMERFIDVGGFSRVKPGRCGTAQRLVVIATVFSFAVLFRLVSFWEVEVVSRSDCPDFSSLTVRPAAWVSELPQYHFYSFYAVSFIQVFLPFCLLLILNIGIIWRIRVALNRDGDVFQRHSVWQCRQKEENLRAATRLLVSLISSYLIFNSLNLTITCLEHLADRFLAHHKQFYTFCVDSVNLLFVITSSTRFLIYLLCSEKMRDETTTLLVRILGYMAAQQADIKPAKNLDRIVVRTTGRTSVTNALVALMSVETSEAFV